MWLLYCNHQPEKIGHVPIPTETKHAASTHQLLRGGSQIRPPLHLLRVAFASSTFRQAIPKPMQTAAAEGLHSSAVWLILPKKRKILKSYHQASSSGWIIVESDDTIHRMTILPPFHNTCHFGFSRYISFIIFLCVCMSKEMYLEKSK